MSFGIPNDANWGFGATEGGVLTLANDGVDNYLKAEYPIPTGGGYFWGGYTPPTLQQDIYIQLWARMPGVKYGLKFVKLFGKRTGVGGNNYANSTFGLDYTGINFGSMYTTSFGDGTDIANDTASIISFDGTNKDLVGRSFSNATINTPQNHLWSSANWGTSWHKFNLHARLNSGTTSLNEVADGAYEVYIDDVPYVIASGLFNKHPSNLFYESVSLFGWSQGGTDAFEIDIKKVTISTGGWVN